MACAETELAGGRTGVSTETSVIELSKRTSSGWLKSTSSNRFPPNSSSNSDVFDWALGMRAGGFESMVVGAEGPAMASFLMGA